MFGSRREDGSARKGQQLPGNTYSARCFSCRTGRPCVNSSPTEEPVMDSIAQFVTGLVTSRTARAGRLTAQQ
jgi:hypothetical protein